jgi:hypothetical protein
VTFAWDSDQRFGGLAQVETAVGMLMELCGWDSTTARSRLLTAAVIVDTPVETVATALLALGPEHAVRMPATEVPGPAELPAPNTPRALDR